MVDGRQSWRVSKGQCLRRREWDGEAVLFNDLSGATHLLSPVALWLIERLEAAPDELAGLAAALDAELAAEAAGDGAAHAEGDSSIEADRERLAELLDDLHALDLIEPC